MTEKETLQSEVTTIEEGVICILNGGEGDEFRKV